jgi:hypothetical protein
MVQAYNKHVIPGRVGGLQMAPHERGLYRLRTANDASFAGGVVYGYSRKSGFGAWTVSVLQAAMRVTIAVTALLGWVIGVFLYRDTPVALFEIGTTWLTLAHLLVPVGFFCIFLTNRRYGPGYAFAQVLATIGAVVLFVVLAGPELGAFIRLDSIPTLRDAASFGGAFVAASFVATLAFDGARGPSWWTAPLFGFLSAAIVFPAVYFPALYAGADSVWLANGLQYMGVLAVEGILLLLPFWALRRMVPPMAGFGGY